jgi:hypothetical protein
MDQTFANEYSSRLYVLSQQKGSRFIPYVQREHLSGAAAMYFDTLAPAGNPTAATVLHGDTPIVESDFGIRKVTSYKWDTGHQLDSDQLARMKVNPTSGIIQNDVYSFGRFTDEKIRDAALGLAYIGKDGTSSVSLYQESQGINGDGTISAVGTLPAVATIAGLTVQKMRAMKFLFDDADVDPDLPRYWACTPADINYLLSTIAVTNSDYNTVKALADGKVGTFMGFNFIPTNRLTKDAATGTGYRTFAWVDGAIIHSEISAMQTQMAPDPGKKFETIIYSKMDFGVVRMEGVKVHECLNSVALIAGTAINTQTM